MDKPTKDIKQFWDKRAKEYAGKPEITTNDIWLRRLEINTIAAKIKQYRNITGTTHFIFDVGCGDGYSTVELAKLFNMTFMGLDYSEKMIKLARERKEKCPRLLKNRLEFEQDDITDGSIHERYFRADVIITDRCLISIPTKEQQIKAFENIYNLLDTHGIFICLESFLAGQNNLNNARTNMGLSPISVHWYNNYFELENFADIISKYFRIVEIDNFASSYYFATRILYTKMCQLEGEREPDYDNMLSRAATMLPSFGNFSPLRLIVLRKKLK